MNPSKPTHHCCSDHEVCLCRVCHMPMSVSAMGQAIYIAKLMVLSSCIILRAYAVACYALRRFSIALALPAESKILQWLCRLHALNVSRFATAAKRVRITHKVYCRTQGRDWGFRTHTVKPCLFAGHMVISSTWEGCTASHLGVLYLLSACPGRSITL